MISYSADPLLHLCWFQLNDTAVPYDQGPHELSLISLLVSSVASWNHNNNFMQIVAATVDNITHLTVYMREALKNWHSKHLKVFQNLKLPKNQKAFFQTEYSLFCLTSVFLFLSI